MRVVSVDPQLEGADCSAFAARLVEDIGRGHVVVPFWSAHQLTIALLAHERFGLRPALTRFEIVADDSVGGAIMHRIGNGFGLSMQNIHTRGNPQRLQDVATWMRRPKPFFIAVDGGATYGTVPTGIVRLASRLGSILWPVGIAVRPVMRIPRLIAEVPMPRARIALGIEAPLVLDRTTPVADNAELIRTRLNAATAAAAVALTTSDPREARA